jgi:hypothetical protein
LGSSAPKNAQKGCILPIGLLKSTLIVFVSCEKQRFAMSIVIIKKDVFFISEVEL